MKKIAALFLLLITISGFSCFTTQENATARPIHSIQRMSKKQTDKIVYTTKATKTYHRGNCRHKSFTTPQMLKDVQKKNYTPCKVCNP